MLNICSLKNKVLNLEKLADDRKNLGKALNFICLTEHWLREYEVQSTIIQNFEILSSNSRQIFKNGGTMIASSSNNGFETRSRIDLQIENCEKHFETSAIEMRLKNRKSKIVLLNLYRSPSGDIKMFFDKFEKVLNLISNEKSDFVICGDFNIDLNSNTIHKNKLMDLVKSFGAKSVVKQPTRIALGSSTLIDLIFSNIGKCRTEVETIGFSDHSIVHLELSDVTEKCFQQFDVTKIRKTKSDNLNALESLLAEETWEEVYDSTNVDVKFNTFLEKFSLHLSATCPLTTRCIRRYNSPDWITPGIKKSGITLSKLLAVNGLLHSTVLKQKIKKFVQIYQKVIKESKKMIVEKQLKDARAKPDVLWRVIKNEYQSSYISRDIPYIINDGVEVSDPIEVATELNKSFAKTATCLKSNWRNHSRNFSRNFYFYDISYNEVLNVIRSLKNKGTLDIYGISCKLVKRVGERLINPLVNIIQSVVEQATFPERAKYARVVPLYKISRNYDISNFRPISCLPIFSKIIEKVITNRISNFSEKNNLIYEHQYGYCLNRGTNDAMFRVTDQVYKHLNDHKLIGIIFLDLSKAFDTVNHALLLRKLDSYGFRGQINDLLQSYLSERRQRVVVKKNGKTFNSDWTNLSQGVPQGSILGPELFKIFINDLPQCLNNSYCDTVIFADDSTIIINADDQLTLTDRINETLSRIKTWCSESGLLLNEKKTHIMSINNSRTLAAGGHHKYLGLEFDNSMTFNHHIEKLCGKLNKVCYQLRQLKSKVNLKTLILIYYANFYSLMSYGIIIWGTSPHANKIFMIQKKAIRIIFGLSNIDSCRPIFKSHKLLTFTSVYILEVMKFFRKNEKIFDCDKRVRPSMYFVRNCREQYAPVINRYRMCERGVRSMAIKLTNGFSRSGELDSVMNAITNISYIGALKVILIDGCYYTINEAFPES